LAKKKRSIHHAKKKSKLMKWNVIHNNNNSTNNSKTNWKTGLSINNYITNEFHAQNVSVTREKLVTPSLPKCPTFRIIRWTSSSCPLPRQKNLPLQSGKEIYKEARKIAVKGWLMRRLHSTA
jgi:hypothetical protein